MADVQQQPVLQQAPEQLSNENAHKTDASSTSNPPTDTTNGSTTAPSNPTDNNNENNNNNAPVKKRKAPVRKKTEQPTPQKKKKSKEELQWAIECMMDFSKVPQQLSVEQVQDIVAAYDKTPPKKITWENEQWKIVFERCWGLAQIKNDDFDNWQKGYKEASEETNWIVRYPHKMELINPNNNKVIAESQVEDDDEDWFIVTSTKLFAQELQESLNSLFPNEKHVAFITPVLDSMKGYNVDRQLTIALGTGLDRLTRPDSFKHPEVSDKYRKTRLTSVFNAQLKGHKLVEFEGKEGVNLLVWVGVKNQFLVGFYYVRKEEADDNQGSDNEGESDEAGEASDNYEHSDDEDE